MSKPLSCPELLLPFVYRWSRTQVGLASAETLPEVGVDLLSAGFDTPEVVGLAICDPADDAELLQRATGRAFASLGVGSDDSEFHEVIVGHSVARQIVDESVVPEESLGEMVCLWRMTCHSKLFEDWMILGEAIYLCREGLGSLEPFLDLTENTIADTIGTLARKFLEHHIIHYEP